MLHCTGLLYSEYILDFSTVDLVRTCVILVTRFIVLLKHCSFGIYIISVLCPVLFLEVLPQMMLKK